jgi:RsiW-degrading membrane proteinase PrsW (M82 family)
VSALLVDRPRPHPSPWLRVRRLGRSLAAHPPFTPLVMRAWLPLGVTSIVLALAAVQLESAHLLVAALVLGSIAGPIAFLVDLQHRTGLAWHPPRAMLMTGAFLGGPLAVLVAQWLEHDFPPLGPNAETLLIGPIEEASKLLVPALLLLVHRTSQRGALICAVAAAASFQAIENSFVAFGPLLHDQGGSVAASTGVLVARGVIGPFTHCMWTSTVAIGWFGTRADRRVLSDPRSRRLVGWFLVVAAMHSLWDVSTGVQTTTLALGLAGLSMAGTLLAHHVATRPQARRWERSREGTSRLTNAWLARATLE